MLDDLHKDRVENFQSAHKRPVPVSAGQFTAYKRNAYNVYYQLLYNSLTQLKVSIRDLGME